jgi:hypothetical protein
MMNRLEPRRAAAAQIGLFGVVWIENADGSPQCRDDAWRRPVRIMKTESYKRRRGRKVAAAFGPVGELDAA